MNKSILLFFGLISFSATTNAQLYVSGDINKDGKITVSDISELTDIILGKKTAQSPESLIAGTWKSKSGNVMSLLPNGTTRFAGASIYKFDNIANRLTFLNSSNTVITQFDVLEITNCYIKVREIGSTKTITLYDSSLFVNSISLSNSQETMWVGENMQLNVTIIPEDALCPYCFWESSDESIATIDQTGKVTAKERGTVTITATPVDGTKIKASCIINIEKTDANGHEYVDLGLSVKWATCNIGATSVGEYGDYYAWGETATKSSYTWSNYLAEEGGKMINWNSCGTENDPLRDYVYPNETSIANTQYDVAHAKWGGTWRLPTVEEQNEIRNNCYWQWTNNYDGTNKAGYIVYKAKAEADKGIYSYIYPTLSATYTLSDTHIFLPAAGHRSETDLDGTNNVGRYWSANPTTASAPDVSTLSFDPSLILRLSYFRSNGFSVRAVTK